jgi:hypothetical protein
LSGLSDVSSATGNLRWEVTAPAIASELDVANVRREILREKIMALPYRSQHCFCLDNFEKWHKKIRCRRNSL